LTGRDRLPTRGGKDTSLRQKAKDGPRDRLSGKTFEIVSDGIVSDLAAPRGHQTAKTQKHPPPCGRTRNCGGFHSRWEEEDNLSHSYWSGNRTTADKGEGKFFST
jgi:hypothetical protein